MAQKICLQPEYRVRYSFGDNIFHAQGKQGSAPELVKARERHHTPVNRRGIGDNNIRPGKEEPLRRPARIDGSRCFFGQMRMNAGQSR